VVPRINWTPVNVLLGRVRVNPAFDVNKRAIRAPNIALNGIPKYVNNSEPTKAMNEARYMFWFPSCSA
jgi:hypothetical protein